MKAGHYAQQHMVGFNVIIYTWHKVPFHETQVTCIWRLQLCIKGCVNVHVDFTIPGSNLNCHLRIVLD